MLRINKLFPSLLLAFSCFVSQTVVAQSASDVYQMELSENETGVYNHGDWVFFVVKQKCLSNKKYAGTAESKAAEKTFYTMLAREMLNRNVSFSTDIEDIAQPLRNDIKQDVSKSLNVQAVLKHQLLFDRNTKTDNCVQEYVVVMEADQFKPNGVTIPRAQVESSAVKLILASLERNDFLLVKQYLQNLGQTELAEIYHLVGEKQALPINLNINDDFEPCQKPYCNQSDKAYSSYDINKVVATAIEYQGKTKIENVNPSDELAELLYQKAAANFTQGTNAEAIIQDLTLAVNLAPQKAKVWKMLADISRALRLESLAQAASSQYILYQPESAESWVYFYLSMKEVEPENAENLKRWLKKINQTEPFSSWAKKQINGE